MNRLPVLTLALACSSPLLADEPPAAGAPAPAPAAAAPAPAPAPAAAPPAPAAEAAKVQAAPLVDARIPALDEKEWTTLKAGKVVVRGAMVTGPDGKKRGKGVAYVIINKTPDAAWAVITDYDKFPEFMPRLDTVDIKERSPTRMKVVQKLERILFKVVEYTLILNFDAQKKRMEWALDKTADNDIKDTTGSWEFIPYEEGKTFVAYDISLDTGISIPGPIEDYLTKKDLPNVLVSMKKRVESGGKWKK